MVDGYVVFGKKNTDSDKDYKVIDIITDFNTSTYTHKGLKKGTVYNYIVQAYTIEAGNMMLLCSSKPVIAVTLGGKYGNVNILKVNKKSVKLKKGKSITLKVTTKYKGGKKILRKTAFESSNTKIAVVNKKGKITAKKRGKCYIYVYAQNGIFKKIKITIK